MIVQKHQQHNNAPSIFSLLFACSGSIVPAIAARVIFAAALGAFAVIVERTIFFESDDDVTTMSFSPFTALGVAVSLFLGFRNNACYDRWWEGRNQWGKQLIVVRNLGRLLLATGDAALLDEVLRLGMAHTHALRAQLRHSPEAIADRDRFLSATIKEAVVSTTNAADAILRSATERVRKSHKDGSIETYTMIALTYQLDKLGEVQGACERLHLTPLPFPYTLLVQRTVFLYIILAPFAMADEMGWYTPLFNAIVAYTFFGLDELSRQLEKPFANFPQCLPLAAMARNIEISVCEALNELPPLPLKPVNVYHSHALRLSEVDSVSVQRVQLYDHETKDSASDIDTLLFFANVQFSVPDGDMHSFDCCTRCKEFARCSVGSLAYDVFLAIVCTNQLFSQRSGDTRRDTSAQDRINNCH